MVVEQLPSLGGRRKPSSLDVSAKANSSVVDSTLVDSVAVVAVGAATPVVSAVALDEV